MANENGKKVIQTTSFIPFCLLFLNLLDLRTLHEVKTRFDTAGVQVENLSISKTGYQKEYKCHWLHYQILKFEACYTNIGFKVGCYQSMNDSVLNNGWDKPFILAFKPVYPTRMEDDATVDTKLG